MLHVRVVLDADNIAVTVAWCIELLVFTRREALRCYQKGMMYSGLFHC